MIDNVNDSDDMIRKNWQTQCDSLQKLNVTTNMVYFNLLRLTGQSIYIS